MNILTEIIKQLIDKSIDLTDSLLKIKVLASRLKNQTLYNWIDKELSGYNSEDILPKYRKTECILIGNFINGPMNMTNQILATNGLPSFIRDQVEKIEFYQPISVLERYITENNNPLAYAISAEIYGYLTENYKKMGNPYISVYSARKEVDLGIIQKAISEVRNKTLDLLLKLEEEFGIEIDLKELIRKKNQANEIINNTINQTIINKGDGNIINTGNKNSISNKIHIQKSNFEELKNALLKNQISEKEISELDKIIGEKPDFANKLFGPKVNNWIQRMTNKALNGTWKIGIGTAAKLLAELLKQYYGM